MLHYRFTGNELLPHYIEDVAVEGVSGLLFDEYRWNQQVTLRPKIHRVAHWWVVEDYFYS